MNATCPRCGAQTDARYNSTIAGFWSVGGFYSWFPVPLLPAHLYDYLNSLDYLRKYP